MVLAGASIELFSLTFTLYDMTTYTPRGLRDESDSGGCRPRPWRRKARLRPYQGRHRRRAGGFTQTDAWVLALNDALDEFAKVAPRQAKVVELLWFPGISEQEAAEVLDTSERTVRRVTAV